MPSFTIPKDTQITLRTRGGDIIESYPDPVYVIWEGNCQERLAKEMKLKQPPIPTADLVIMDDIIDWGISSPSVRQSAVQSYYHASNSFDTLTNSVPGPRCIPAQEVGQCNKNKEHNMHINLNDGVPTDQKQRDYTLGRLNEIKSLKRNEMRHEFGLMDDDAPMTFEELMARIAAGKFTFPEDKKTTRMGSWSVLEYISWRDPSVKKDEAGFDKASAKLDEAYLAARDQTVLGNSDQGLKILEDFKSATFH